MDERWARRTARARKSGEKNSVEVHYRSTPQIHMKITCQSCQSKYNVADDKVTGKIVKIRCRKCGATIIVDGTTVAETGGNASPSGAPTAAAPSQQPAAGEPAPWHVNVSDNDQRTMTLSEIVDAYNASTITQETFIWTEGMEDWKPLKDVEPAPARTTPATLRVAIPATLRVAMIAARMLMVVRRGFRART
jgi:predicted Zn finger-like uncharacterized protein